MTASPESIEVARRAEELYAQRLRQPLEATHRDLFVAIEPVSGDYFLGKTLRDAGRAARAAHPNRLSYGLRIGHPVAIEIGNCPP